MVNVVVLQGAAVPDSGSAFYLQIQSGAFAGAKEAKIAVFDDVAAYVSKTIQRGLMCIVKGVYVPSGNYIKAESVAFLRDKLSDGDQMWN
jgi:hypothetical protein